MEEVGSDTDLLPQAKECQFSYFLDLALEIRLDIYELLLPRTIKVYEDDCRWLAGENPSILRTCKQIHQEASPLLYGRNTFGIRKRHDGYRIASLSNSMQSEYPDWNFQGASNVLFESLNPEDTAMIKSVIFYIPLSDRSVYKSSRCEVDMIKFSLETFQGVLHQMLLLESLQIRITHHKERMGHGFCENDMKWYQLQERATELLTHFKSLKEVTFYAGHVKYETRRGQAPSLSTIKLLESALLERFRFETFIADNGAWGAQFYQKFC